MTITRTVNYTQNVPASLGFSNYINPSPSRNIRVLFDFSNTLADSKMGTIIFDEIANVTQTHSKFTPDDTLYGAVYIEGPVADINTALNSAQYLNNFYEAEIQDQDWLSQNRDLPTDHRGELIIQINPTVSHGLSVGSFCCISTATANSTTTGQFVVTRIDSSVSPTRMWLMYRGGWTTDDKYFSSSYKSVSVSTDATPCYLQTTGRVNIAPINDIGYCNPYGTFDIAMSIVNSDTTTTEESGTITFNGSAFINEPFFSTPPPATFSTTTTNSWYNIIQNTSVSQVGDNYQSIQYLIKISINDPMYLGVSDYSGLPGYPSGGSDLDKLAFIGAAIDAKAAKDVPVYITDDSYGIFGSVQVNDRQSSVYSTGVVRWNFYGVPNDCNIAFLRSTYYRPPNFTKDFDLEFRIVNNRTRIYATRGVQ